MQQRLNMLLKLEEEREKSKKKLMQHQELIKRWFEKTSVGNKYFQEGDLVLKWDKANEMKGKHTKFQKLWLGPYQIHEKLGQELSNSEHWRETWRSSLSMVKCLKDTSPNHPW
jgi:hypothetical protein